MLALAANSGRTGCLCKRRAERLYLAAEGVEVTAGPAGGLVPSAFSRDVMNGDPVFSGMDSRWHLSLC